MKGIVLVNGAPATGKTTLARELARRLGVPLLSKDAIKETLHDALGGDPVEATARLGAASYEVLRVVLHALADGGASAVVDSNLASGVSEPWLRELAARTPVAYVHLECGRDAIAARYRARSGERHRVHADGADPSRTLEAVDAGRYMPLDLGVPTLLVRTDEGCDPPIETVAAFARDVLGG